MPPIPPLFVLPIPPALTTQGQQGSFICTQAAPQVYLLSFSSPPDNRLVPAFNHTFLVALDIIEHRLPRGVVITTSSITKFYSNGLDFENAIKDPTFFSSSLYPLWRRLITVSPIRI
jgi:Delta3-Delta2-enoyl-CoA isomerase